MIRVVTKPMSSSFLPSGLFMSIAPQDTIPRPCTTSRKNSLSYLQYPQKPKKGKTLKQLKLIIIYMQFVIFALFPTKANVSLNGFCMYNWHFCHVSWYKAGQTQHIIKWCRLIHVPCLRFYVEITNPGTNLIIQLYWVSWS